MLVFFPAPRSRVSFRVPLARVLFTTKWRASSQAQPDEEPHAVKFLSRNLIS